MSHPRASVESKNTSNVSPADSLSYLFKLQVFFNDKKGLTEKLKEACRETNLTGKELLYLIDNGAEPDPCGNDLVQIACNNKISLEEKKEILHALLKKNISGLKGKMVVKRYSTLHTVIKNTDMKDEDGLSEIIKIFLSYYNNANQTISGDLEDRRNLCMSWRRYDNENAAHLCARKNLFSTLKVLIDFGASLELTNYKNQTPLDLIEDEKQKNDIRRHYHSSQARYCKSAFVYGLYKGEHDSAIRKFRQHSLFSKDAVTLIFCFADLATKEQQDMAERVLKRST